MNTKTTSKLLINCTLLASLAILLFFTAKIYKEEKHNYEDTVNEALVSANYKETVMRFTSITPGGKLTSSGMQLSSPANIGNGKTPVLYLYKRVIEDTTAAKTPKDDFDKIFKDGDKKGTDDVSSSLTAGINSAIKSLSKINFEVFDSLLVTILKEKEIDTPYQLELVYKDSTALNKTAATEGFKIPKLTYSYKKEMPLDGEGNIKYIYTAAPFRYILRNISILLILSAVALTIIILSIMLLYKTMVEAKRTEALQEEFTHLVTHNLNNPLSIISASAESLEKKMQETTKENPDCQQYISIIKRQANNLSEEVKSILKPYKIAEMDKGFEKSSINARIKLKNIVDEMALACPEATFEFKADVPEDTTFIACEQMFDKMIGNLIQNAVKYSPEDPHINVTFTESPEKYTISVKDNGIGIPQEKIKNVFDRYFKVEKLSATPGYGLGLFYVKQVIDLHQWQIDVQSVVDKGSDFIITIPR